MSDPGSSRRVIQGPPQRSAQVLTAKAAVSLRLDVVFRSTSTRPDEPSRECAARDSASNVIQSPRFAIVVPSQGRFTDPPDALAAVQHAQRVRAVPSPLPVSIFLSMSPKLIYLSAASTSHSCLKNVYEQYHSSTSVPGLIQPCMSPGGC